MKRGKASVGLLNNQTRVLEHRGPKSAHRKSHESELALNRHLH